MTPLIDDIKIIELLLEDMKTRETFGHKKYNSFVTVYNNRNMLQEAYEEKLDFCVYIKAYILKLQNAPEVISMWQEVIRDVNHLAENNTLDISTDLSRMYWNNILDLYIMKEHLIKQELPKEIL